MELAELLAFIIGTVLVIVHLLIHVVAGLRTRDIAGKFAKIKRKVQQSLGCLLGRNQQTQPSFFDQLVEQKTQLRCAEAAKSCFVAASNGVWVIIASTMYNMALGRPRWMTLGQTVCLIAAFAVLLIANAKPSWTRRWLDFYFGIFMLLLIVFVLTSSPEHLVFSMNGALLARAIFSFYHMNTTNTIFLNLVASAAVCIFASQNQQACVTDSMVYMYELGATGMLLMAVSEIQRWTVTAIRNDIKVSDLTSEISASRSLLDMVCDVSLELNEVNQDLTISCDSRTFAALLMRTSSTSLEGSSFYDFIANENDRSILETRTSDLAPGAVGTCVVGLSDSMHNPVKADLFFVKVNVSADGNSSRFLLGIREFTDEIPKMPAFQAPKAKQRQALAGKGTPSISMPGILETKKLVSKSGALHFPHLAASAKEMVCQQLLVRMHDWNFHVPDSACCSLHAYASEAILSLRLVSRMKCMPGFPNDIVEGMQCQSCGYLDSDDPEELECPFCDGGVFKPTHRAADSQTPRRDLTAL
eukprot:TRINITY_DN81819_c0_g1_i1.p1 TRINITY_DN81819_c0_g1~~TRINITY_DN81819_c0_g1_i1.p1  ORF type:complete len:529 (-),score=74.19 TRINITY_DN81819_c0_g1_i1:45-1631(-)